MRPSVEVTAVRYRDCTQRAGLDEVHAPSSNWPTAGDSPLAVWPNAVVKRVVDLLGSGSLLVLTAPLLVGVALAVRIGSPGPVLFSHRRVGRGGREFMCRKFRTMSPDSDRRLAEILARDPARRREWESEFKLKDDPRVTRIGRFLRRTSLDELPQLWNVVRGEMSLVGPRPIVRDELDRLDGALESYLAVRPGLTGLWQVSGRNDMDYGQRVLLEASYTRNWSLWLDVSLLLRTVRAVFTRRGAY